jgi:hypothetical protein
MFHAEAEPPEVRLGSESVPRQGSPLRRYDELSVIVTEMSQRNWRRAADGSNLIARASS